MAQAIANIPVLEGLEAEDFVRMAEENMGKRGTVDLSEEIGKMKRILKKSRL